MFKSYPIKLSGFSCVEKLNLTYHTDQNLDFPVKTKLHDVLLYSLKRCGLQSLNSEISLIGAGACSTPAG